MKKISFKQRLRQIRNLKKSEATKKLRSKNKIKKRIHIKNKEPRLKRTLVEARFEDRIEEVISIGAPRIPPSCLCLETNFDETIQFLDEWRASFAVLDPLNLQKQIWVQPSKKKDGLSTIGRYSDFSKIEYMSTAVALIMTAEYDRVRTLINSVPPVINLKDWNKATFTKLYEVGFFENIGHLTDIEADMLTQGGLKTMRIQSGKNANDIEKVSKCIWELSEFLESRSNMIGEIELVINSALSEAMINVAKWAYPKEHEFLKKHIGKWWVTASANREMQEMTVVIYDQGASIPVTFAKKRWSETVTDLLNSTLSSNPKFAFSNDGAYILGAMNPGNSNTNQKHRGLGLPEMKDVIDLLGKGSLSIYSRGGHCNYAPDRGLERTSHHISIGGTLIEWKLNY